MLNFPARLRLATVGGLRFLFFGRAWANFSTLRNFPKMQPFPDFTQIFQND
jgi:hypothetical protein